MSHLTIVFLIIGTLVLILGAVFSVRAYLENRDEEMAPFRDYFGSEYDRDLLRQSAWSDDENLYGRRTRYAFNIRDWAAIERDSRAGGTTWRNRNRD